MSALYDCLIERDLDAIPAAARAFLETSPAEDLWTAVARFAVLSYAPSQHAKRAVMAVRAVHDLREEAGERWVDWIVECARYAAESRQPWSEPPMLDPPEVDPSQPPNVEELRAAIETKDRPRAEQWLAARVDDADGDLRAVARGDALLLTDAVLALAPHLGEKGRYALLRIAIWEMLAGNSEELPAESLDALIAKAIAENGSLESVRNVLLVCSQGCHPERERGTWAGGGERHGPSATTHPGPSLTLGMTGFVAKPLHPYHLARDYAQTLLAHAARLPQNANIDGFLAAVRDNLERGEGYEDWTLA